MNKKGFISISIIYSFFLVFIAIILAILAMYSSRRLSLTEIKNDVKNLIDSKSHFDCLSNGITKLNECIIYKYGGEESISIFSGSFSEITTKGDSTLYKMTDDYGDSYYFRGDAKDNYVQFGQNNSGEDMYWRIVRINGNGTIRMIYDGTSLKENGITSSDVIIDTCNYGVTEYWEGYIKYSQSIVKRVVDYWYEDNLYNYYKDYIDSDTLFCNDKEEAFGEYCEHTNLNNTCELDENNEIINCSDKKIDKTCSADMSDDIYNAVYASTIRITNKYSRPKLTCTQSEDELTVGNGLKYPIGILSLDEVAVAGGVFNVSNKSYYLYRGNPFWVMTAYDNGAGIKFVSGNAPGADVWYVKDDGAIGTYDGLENRLYPSSVRPVINLISSVEIKKGEGTVDSPYVLEEVGY